MVQYQAAGNQSLRRNAHCEVYVDGKNVTDVLDPYLISVEVNDKLVGMDECHIELDDRDGKLAIPPDDATVQVRLGWSGQGPRVPPVPTNIPAGGPAELPYEASGMLAVFNGWVHSVECGFARRGGGRRMWIEAMGAPMKGHGKSVDSKTWGEGPMDLGSAVTTEANPEAGGGGGGGGGIPFSQVMSEIAGSAGYSLNIESGMGAIARPFWHMGDESFHNFVDRMASELGGFAKISGNTVSITPGGGKYLNAQGQVMPTIEAVWGLNLISYRIKPYVGRPQIASAKSKFFQISEGLWSSISSSVGGSTPFGNAKAIGGLPGAAPNSSVGGQSNEGLSADSQARRGTGWCVINGEPTVTAGARMLISGARPGVDGSYRIAEAHHIYTRSAGYTTRCDLSNPDLAGPWDGWGSQGKLPAGAGAQQQGGH